MERPILFSTPMVQAILEDRKLKTRRVIKPHRKAIIENMWIDKDDGDVVVVYNDNYHIGEKGYIKCPYGKPGDILWVRETWQNICASPLQFAYKADGEFEPYSPWHPSIHMPRVACRLRLKITDIRVERLQDITEEDARAEGILEFSLTASNGTTKLYGYRPDLPEMAYTAKEAFHDLWDSINKERGFGWDIDPWVWVISFERV